MYRPTLRMNNLFRTWVDDLFKVTSLDRNQILRLAITIGGQSPEFISALKTYQKEGHSLPSPRWEGLETWLWFEQDGKREEGERDVNGSGERDTNTFRNVRGTSTTPLLRGNTRTTFENGIRVLHENENGRERETTRRVGEVHNRQRKDGFGIIELGNVQRVDGTIRVSF